ncbi:MAG: hypothetical protein NT013_23570 [Planctomycetia bacterium]|nr:hypothetical protein [Planctomycetia bacterium]
MELKRLKWLDDVELDGVKIMSVQDLIEQSLQLPAADRAEVAAEMLFSLSPDESLDGDECEWIAEIQTRREEVSRGVART